MLCQWFGVNYSGGQWLTRLVQLQRVWNVEKGLYTSRRHYVQTRTFVTDDVLARFGFNL